MQTALALAVMTAFLTSCTSLQIPEARNAAAKAETPLPPLKPIRSIDDFLKSRFCAVYKCRFNDAWRMKNGNIEEVYTTLPDEAVWTEKRDGKLIGFFVIITRHGDLSHDPDEYVDAETWEYIDSFLAALNGKSEDPTMALYAHAHFAGTVNQLSDAKAIRYGSYRLRLATVGTDPTIDARFIPN